MSRGACVCRPARPDEMETVFAIRRRVFCAEQALFAGSDADAWDAEAVHLVAEEDGRVIGTVRLYERAPGVWVGGRLAVLPDHRGSAGFRLVRRAVLEAERRGAEAFEASVQSSNERFFHRLGWRTTGDGQPVAGVRHVVMSAPLYEAGSLRSRVS